MESLHLVQQDSASTSPLHLSILARRARRISPAHRKNLVPRASESRETPPMGRMSRLPRAAASVHCVIPLRRGRISTSGLRSGTRGGISSRRSPPGLRSSSRSWRAGDGTGVLHRQASTLLRRLGKMFRQPMIAIVVLTSTRTGVVMLSKPSSQRSPSFPTMATMAALTRTLTWSVAGMICRCSSSFPHFFLFLFFYINDFPASTFPQNYCCR